MVVVISKIVTIWPYGISKELESTGTTITDTAVAGIVVAAIANEYTDA